MCGNGVKTPITIAMPINQRIPKTTATLYGCLVMSLCVFCAVVLVSTIRGAVTRRSGTGSLPMFVTSISVFVWLCPCSRIPYPLLFYPLSLCLPNAAVGVWFPNPPKSPNPPKISNCQPNSLKISTLIPKLTIPHSRFNIVE